MGIIIGLLSGVAEFLLLRAFIALYTKGQMMKIMGVFLLNLVVMAGSLLLVAFVWRTQLVAAAIAMAASLIVLAVGAFFVARRAQKEEQ